MSLASVRAAVAALLGTVPEVAEALPYPPEAVGPLPCAWVGGAQAAVTMGSPEVWAWRLPVTVAAAARHASLALELAATEPLVEAVTAAVRAGYTLGGTTFGLQLQQVSQDLVKVGSEDYVGLTFVFLVKEKRAVSYTG